ncbi:MAG: hypothetical protein OEW48_11800 [Phycisphaerae bacterium]|nr:hypothetical protein [Phycisphaerae bacterium]
MATMYNAKRTLLIVMVFCVILDSVCSAGTARNKVKPKKPTALELLDNYAETQDKIYKSFVIKWEEAREQYDSHSYGGLEGGKRKGGTFCEMRFDGTRFYAIHNDWGNCMPEVRSFIPRNDPKYSVILWDGSFHYIFGKLPNKKLRELAEQSFKTIKEREEFLKEKSGMLTITNQAERAKGGPDDFLGAITGHCDDFFNPRLISILRQASKISLRDEMQRIGKSKCYVVDAESKLNRYTIWIDPEHSYNIAQLDNKWEKTSEKSRKEAGKIQRHISMKDVRFKKSAGIWIPVEAVVTDVTRNFGNGMLRITKRRYKRTDVLLNPDHAGLGSFTPDFPNGCRVHVKGLEGIDESKNHTWRDGQVVDDKGQVVFDSKSKKSGRR